MTSWKLLHSYPCTHLVLFILEWDFKGLGCTDHGLHWSKDVLVDQFGETFPIFICVAWAMNYSHLLDKGALATFSSAFTGGKRKKKKVSRYQGEHPCPLSPALFETIWFNILNIFVFELSSNTPMKVQETNVWNSSPFTFFFLSVILSVSQSDTNTIHTHKQIYHQQILTEFFHRTYP